VKQGTDASNNNGQERWWQRIQAYKPLGVLLGGLLVIVVLAVIILSVLLVILGQVSFQTPQIE
jgi:hypothetical protein